MRISDWSSDVCSSDLFQHPFRLMFLGRNETDSIFVQAFGRKILLDVAGPAKFIFGGPFRGGKRFGVADNHGAVLVSHAISPARLSSVTPASAPRIAPLTALQRSEEHTSEVQSLMRISYAVFCLKTITHDDTVEKHIINHHCTTLTLAYI